MKPRNQILISGAVGAAIATGVVITVYEGHVVAETHGTRTEMSAGTRAMLDGTGQAVAAAQPDPNATREELAARASVQATQIVELKTRIAELEKQSGGARRGHADEQEEGRLWHDPSHDKLVEWAAECHIRGDEPGVSRFTPVKRGDDNLGLEANEVDAYNATVTEVAKQWQTLIRALYVEVTGDAAGADTLSVDAMRNEIEQKSPHGEHNLVLQRISRERAGLQAPPADPSKTSPLERMVRAFAALGDQTEEALAKRLGAKRAHDIRGDAWGHRSDSAGCPSP